jgi:hypothetical protein
MDRIKLIQMRRRFNGTGGVDQNDFHIVAPGFHKRPQHHPADAPKSTDRQSRCHFAVPLLDEFIGGPILRQLSVKSPS